MVKKVYVDSDGSRYDENKAYLLESIKHIEEKGDFWWDLSIGLIADLNTSCSALGKPVIQDPESFLQAQIESRS
ncbi:hypothetical protein IKG28_02325 [Candidatus Saccharibacteria bacterium]|nr:hypothetical protein [Candidatus Saccharibacteria bacterium]